MTNNFLNPNPYGKIDLGSLIELEKRVGSRFPEDYREYLITYNGGEFSRKLVKLNERDSTKIHHIFGLHSGPQYRQLNRVYDDVEGRLPDKFVPICDDSFGNFFCIGLEGINRGCIFFLDHEVNQAEASKGFFEISSSFSRFVDELRSEDDFMDDFRVRDPDGYADFEKRLEEMKRLADKDLNKK